MAKAEKTVDEQAEEMYQQYLAAGGGGVLGTVGYFREVVESTTTEAEADRG